MSTIEILYHDEFIENIFYQKPPARPKSPMPVSNRIKQLKLQGKHAVKTHLTMGEAETTLKAPCQFLRKGEGVKKVVSKNDKCRDLYKKKTEISEKPKEENKPNKNVVNKKEKEKMNVDTPRGHKIVTLENKWVYKKGYGTTPKYVLKRINQKRRDEERYRRELENQEPLCKPVPAKEREHLLNGLKEKQRELGKSFLLLPVIIDTIPLLMKKDKLEHDLRKIEKDVELVEKNPYIYLYL